MFVTFAFFADLTILVERKAGSGSYGAVRVGYTTLAPQESYPYLPAGTPRASRLDYEETMGTVTLTPGERSMTFTVEILEDEEPEMEETFFVRLVSVELTQSGQERPGMTLTYRTLNDLDNKFQCQASISPESSHTSCD